MKKVIFTLAGLLAITVFAKGQDRELRQRIEQHVGILAHDSLGGRSAGSVYADKAAKYIADRFREIGLAPLGDDEYYQHFDFKRNVDGTAKPYKNVVGAVYSDDPALDKQYILIGAHYDHLGYSSSKGKLDVFNGADDNASGVAALIETARIIHENRNLLKRSVLFVAFDAEEIGLHGSSYFVANSPVPVHNIVVMMSVDMVGWLKSGEVSYHGVGTIKDGAGIVSDPSIIPQGLNVATRKFERGVFSGTDTDPFARAGISTMHVTTGVKSPYHTTRDVAEWIDYNGMVLITNHLAVLTEKLSRNGDLKNSGRIASKHRSHSDRFQAGISLYGGYNSLRYSSGPYRGKIGGSFGAGVYAQMNYGWVGVRPEVFYERDRTPYSAGTIHTNSVVVPVSLVLQTPIDATGGLYMTFGGYYRYIFSGSMGGNKMNFSDFYRNEGGIQWGGGFWLYNFGIGFTCRYGLSNRLRNTVSAEGQSLPNIRNRVTLISLSYRF